MEIKTETLEKYFAELRRRAERRTAGAERNIRRVYREIMRELRGHIGNQYASWARDGTLSYADLQRVGRYARFIEEVQARVNWITPQISKEIQAVVADVYEIGSL